MELAKRLAASFVLAAASCGLLLTALHGTGADRGAICGAASLVFSISVVIAACLVYDDRRGARPNGGRRDRAEAETFVRAYRSGKALRLVAMGLLAAAVAVAAVASASVGPNDISMSDVPRLIRLHLAGHEFVPGTEDWLKDVLLWEVRLPRVVVALVSGAGLAVGGAVMQAVVKNPLADPFTTGISSGAVLGASMFMVLGLSVSGDAAYGMVANAFLFSLIPVAILVAVSRIAGASPVTVILIGTAVSCIFSSFDTLMMTVASEDALHDAFVWQVGTLSRSTWDSVPPMLTATAVLSTVLFLTSNKLNLLMAGDAQARSLGLNVDNYRALCLVTVALITASIVSFIGLIGFVGLIVPHFVRMVMGSDSRLVLPASMLTGSAAMLAADIVARAVSSSAVPVGVVLSFTGGPLFLLLVARSRREAWTDEV